MKAKGKTKKQQADEAYLKSETLRGQLDAFDGVQGATTDKPPIHDSGESPPPVCPHCFKAMNANVVAGGRWTHLKPWWDDEQHKLQCNNCGGIVVVSQKVWQMVREDAMAAFGGSDNRKKKHYNKRERGAG